VTTFQIFYGKWNDTYSIDYTAQSHGGGNGMDREKRKTGKRKWLKVSLLGIAGLLLVLILGFLWYVNDYSKATDAAVQAMTSDSAVAVTAEDGTTLFKPVDEDPTTGIIFYPGGKVDEKAYAPLLKRLAAQGYAVFLVSMPFHLAVFDSDAAEPIIAEQGQQIQKWYLSGHSLGGVMAAQFAAQQPDEIAGLIFLAAYPAVDLSGTSLAVLSLYGSDDGVLDLAAYNDAKKYMPDDYKQFVIMGGNHAQFGDYGRQAGDGVAAITAAEQQQAAVDEIVSFIGKQ
jgi:hypothetical protein